jgi:hypothetical protein
MLRVWFSFRPFLPSESDVKMTAILEVRAKDKQHAKERFGGV